MLFQRIGRESLSTIHPIEIPPPPTKKKNNPTEGLNLCDCAFLFYLDVVWGVVRGGWEEAPAAGRVACPGVDLEAVREATCAEERPVHPAAAAVASSLEVVPVGVLQRATQELTL